MKVYDDPHEGKKWPIWWEDSYDPNRMGNVCVICGHEMEGDEVHMFARGVDFDADNEFGSGFCVCVSCVKTWGHRPSFNNIDRHDRAVLQRFSAVYRALRQEIKNGRTQGWRTVGALQSGWAHYGHHQ